MADNQKRKKVIFTEFKNSSRFTGILEYSSPLRILGKFNGEIKGKDILEIGSSAEVEAYIETTELVVYGKIKGNIVATEGVELRSGAVLIGNIRTPNLEIDDGVIFEGKCEMEQKKKEVA